MKKKTLILIGLCYPYHLYALKARMHCIIMFKFMKNGTLHALEVVQLYRHCVHCARLPKSVSTSNSTHVELLCIEPTPLHTRYLCTE